ncbi:polysaccharide lyase [Pararhizobium sp. BT-229]|uniref:polysaccharide lyase n=1 Tax=Pararhizobium sp. BT-229 TaxID=2986923 RepID=UPI0021F7D735|nr:polysaccharide lyase [Pararhizobium sp. BT-229]MCV9965909.1 polysaccharide lyase [Pararhizobium sp. BT-229]
MKKTNHRIGILSCAALLAVSAIGLPQQLAHANTKRIADAAEVASSLDVRPLTEGFYYNNKFYKNHSAQKDYSIGARRSANDNVVLRFEVRGGENAYFDPEHKDRSEVTTSIRFPKDKVVWNAYRVRIGSGFQVPSDERSWFIIGQWHGDANDRRPPYIAVEVQGKDLVFLSRDIASGKPVTHEMYRMHDVPRHEWLNIAMEHKVSATDGLLNIWLNGHQVVKFNGPVGYWDHNDAGYWKFGIYRSRQDTDAVVEYREVVTTTNDLTARAEMTN